MERISIGDGNRAVLPQAKKPRWNAVMRSGLYSTISRTSPLLLGDRYRLAAQCIQSQHGIVPAEVFPALQSNRDIAVTDQEVVEITQGKPLTPIHFCVCEESQDL